MSVSSLKFMVVEKVLWWRFAYPFHWAHKPLCARFERDVWRVGSIHLCRSCALLRGAFALTLAAGFAWPFGAPAALPWSIGVALVALLSQPPLYRRFHRRVKDGVRLATGVVAALTVWFLIKGFLLHGAGGVSLLGLGYALGRSPYRRLKRHACDGCPELTRPGVCSGYRLQADRARRYEEVATTRLLQSGYTPPRLSSPRS